ncbi:MAG: [protein-PII] uridylyltransferase [Deltaproteobacteria bacterium RBG_13_65_10]|nr:MAG: [protein-PII] uridylyltransferase [Deltaproteobacteria bacterium RBG_13_65_10]
MPTDARADEAPLEEREALAELAGLEEVREEGSAWAHADIVARTKAFLARKHEILEHMQRDGDSSRSLMDVHTRLLDALLQTLFRLAEADFYARYTHLDHRLAIVAQGGYGRCEMAPYSDVDILFLHPYKVDSYVESVTERILLVLWDSGVQVGSAVRTVADCVRLSANDLMARTALMDTRYVAGDRPLADELHARILRDVVGRNVQVFVREKLRESQRRHEKHGASIFVLEPNVKDGLGGLRDFHTALWIVKAVYKVERLRDLLAKGVVTEKELEDFERSIEFMWRVRNELHLLSDRKNDQIQFEYQERIAADFRYRTNGRQQPEERFMQHYYLHARNVLQCATMLIERATALTGRIRPMVARLRQRVVAPGFKIYEGQLALDAPDLFDQRPEAMMEAFELAQKHGVEFAASLRDRIREHMRRIDRRFRNAPEVNQIFLRILERRKDLPRILYRMNDTRVLGRYIPEFGRVVCKVQRDAFHVYTVDVHSLKAIEELVNLEDGVYEGRYTTFRDQLRKLPTRRELYLACLLHDVGKGQGKDHHLHGKAQAIEVCSRMGLPPEEVDRVAFLVENHLLMVHYALRRDMNDFRLVADLAHRCDDPQNLALLFLLSFADVRAVAPDIWTNWKGGLLELLYHRTHDMLERGDFEPDETEHILDKQRRVREIVAGKIPEEQLDRFFKNMVNRFFLSLGPRRISRCIRIWNKLENKAFTYDVKQQHKSGATTFIVCAPDSKGLFSKIAGVMAANNANIVSASIFTTLDGTALDIYQVSDPVTMGPITDGAKWKAIVEDLRRVLMGEESVEALVARRRPPSKLLARRIPRRPPQVEIDNEASDFYTVIDIDAQDRVGLLYDITHALVELDLGIFISRIMTRRGKVDDVFYVKNSEGRKIEDPEQLAEIRRRVLEVIRT